MKKGIKRLAALIMTMTMVASMTACGGSEKSEGSSGDTVKVGLLHSMTGSMAISEQAVLDAEKLNQGFVVFCSVKLRRLNRDIAAEFTRIIQDIPEVTECYNISGSYDYLLKIHAPNMKYYQEFILNVLGTIDSLGSLESTFVMAEVKHQYGIHI